MPIISNFPTGGGSGGGLALAALRELQRSRRLERSM